MFPVRKQIRLPDYDYSQNGAYFVTFCTRDRKNILWENAVGTASGRPSLSQYGLITQTAIQRLSEIYPSAHVDKYVIMPNHIHLIVMLSGDDGRPMAVPTTEDGGRPVAVPTISRLINQLKGYVSKKVGFSMWQSRFYEHIIRNEQDYLTIWEYIDVNPAKWADDEYFVS